MAPRTRSFERPPTAQIAVLRELRRAICHGDIAPGAPIPQEAIAEQFGVSRVPIREALKILEGEGHVTYEPHHGYTVTQLKVSELLEIYRIRELLEEYAVRLAVPQLTAETFTQLDRLLTEMDDAAVAGDIAALTDANRDFHFTIIAASRQAHLTKIIRQLWDSSDPYRSVYFKGDHNRALVQREHRAIVSAAASRDTERLLALLNEHRDHARAALAAVLSDDPAAEDAGPGE